VFRLVLFPRPILIDRHLCALVGEIRGIHLRVVESRRRLGRIDLRLLFDIASLFFTIRCGLLVIDTFRPE
jgi:hypothetical protein